jgi:hypothetical protein
VIQRVAAEALGTALLLAIVVGSGIMGQNLAAGNNAVALLANTIATGAGLFTLITVFGPISGAHFNPAVTVAAVIQRSLRVKEAAAFLAAQFVGACAGVFAAHAMFGLPLVQASSHARGTVGECLGEVTATHYPSFFACTACACCRRGLALDHSGLLVHILHQLRQSGGDVCAVANGYICGHRSEPCDGVHRFPVSGYGIGPRDCALACADRGQIGRPELLRSPPGAPRYARSALTERSKPGNPRRARLERAHGVAMDRPLAFLKMAARMTGQHRLHFRQDR